jgi:hypothetical protein
MPLSGGRRRRHHKRRHGGDGDGDNTVIPGTGGAENDLKVAGQMAGKVGGEVMEGGRRRKMTAKKMVKKLRVLAKQAKKLTLRLKKMKKHH